MEHSDSSAGHPHRPLNLSRPLFLALLILTLTAACSSLPDKHSPGKVERLAPETAELATKAAPTPKPALTLEDISALHRNGASSADILAKLRDTGTTLRLTAADILLLNRYGIPNTLIDALLDAERSAQRDVCIGDLNRLEQNAQLLLLRQRQEWMFRCQTMMPSPFFPPPFFWHR